MALDDDIPEFRNDQDEARYWKSLAKDLDSELESTREALEEYQASSKELEQELERDIEAREKREAQLNTLLELAQSEVQDWRSKYQSSLKEHSKTLNHITKELDTVRKSEEAYRTKVRDMELDNDDLEKSERALGSTLSDLEARYGKAIERTALLEEELVGKARLEEEVQRSKDELRDLNEEIAVLQEQSTRAPSRMTDILPSRSATPNATLPTSPEPVPIFPQTQSGLLTDGPTPSTSRQSEPEPSAEATPKKSVDLSKAIKRTSGIPRSTSAHSINSSVPRSQQYISSASPDFRPFPTATSPTLSRMPTSATMVDLASVASGKDASPQIRAKVSSGAKQRPRLSSLAPSATQATPSPSGQQQRTTPKALREARANGMMHDLQSMTARVKAMTARVDGRRAMIDRPPWSSIPKPAATPQRTPLTSAQASAAQARIAARRAAARGGSTTTNATPRASVSRRSFASPSSLEDELSRAQVESPTSRAMSRRPPSRNSMSFSRPTTPNLYNRPSTPSSQRPRTASRLGQRPPDSSSRQQLRRPSVKMVSRRTSLSRSSHASTPPPLPPPAPPRSDSQQEEDERW